MAKKVCGYFHNRKRKNKFLKQQLNSFDYFHILTKVFAFATFVL